MHVICPESGRSCQSAACVEQQRCAPTGHPLTLFAHEPTGGPPLACASGGVCRDQACGGGFCWRRWPGYRPEAVLR